MPYESLPTGVVSGLALLSAIYDFSKKAVENGLDILL